MGTMIQDHEIDSWLGDVVNELDADQLDEFQRLVRAYHETQDGRPGEPADYFDEDEAAWRAALEQVEGTLDVEQAGREYHGAKRRAYAAAIIATLAGMSEVEAARAAGISRPTLRKALRK
jgi:DNA-binding phage protein